MTELSDYKRLVERPMVAAHAERVMGLTARIEKLEAALIQVRGFAGVMAENNWKDLRLHIERQCAVLRD